MRTPGLVLAAAFSLLATQALAHAHLLRSDPPAGAVLRKPPQRLWLGFDDFLRLPGSGVQLSYPDGRRIWLSLARDPKDRLAVIASLPPPLPPGPYQVLWRALSPNAFRTHGGFSFTIRP